MILRTWNINWRFKVGVLLFGASGLIASTSIEFSYSADSSHTASYAWKPYALLLNSENQSDVDHAIHELRALPHLEDDLNETLNNGSPEERSVAYQVIEELDLEKMMGTLLKRLHVETERYYFSALCTLSSRSEQKEISDSAESALLDSIRNNLRLSSGAKVSILKCFHRLRSQLTVSDLNRATKVSESVSAVSHVLNTLFSAKCGQDIKKHTPNVPWEYFGFE